VQGLAVRMHSPPAAAHHQPATAPRPWWQDAVFYHILVDRFRRAGAAAPLRDPTQPVFCGGNLRGVIESLDHLRHLGVTALWLSPVQCTSGYHGYHITDYQRVEARFGGMAAFRALLRAASPCFRIVIDWVPNHVHRAHPFFQAALRSKHSPYRDWFYFDRDGGYRCFLDFAELPKLNLDQPEARRYMIGAARRWLDLGVDGFRLDHVLGPSLGFWRQFRAALRAHKPSVYLVGEAAFAGIRRRLLPTIRLPHKHRYLLESKPGVSVTDAVMREYTGAFDGLLDFGFQEILANEVARARQRPSARRVQSLLDAHYEGFPAGFSLPSFLDNHDMSRFLFAAGDDKARLMQAAEIQFHQEQPPIIYYGTEVGMSQAGAVEGVHGDLQARQMMPWKHQDEELLEFYVELIRQRKRRRPAAAGTSA